MENPEFNTIVLKRKKDKVISTIYLACKYCHLTVPKVNFDGCPSEGANGPEKAHYHREVGGKICMSESQLKLQDLSGLEETSIHEVMHHLGLMHDSNAEHVKFEQVKRYVRSAVWRPDDIPLISDKDINKENTRIQTKPRLEGRTPSHPIKPTAEDQESEVRILIHQLEEARGEEERAAILNEIFKLRSRLGNRIEIKSDDIEAIDKLNSVDKENVNKILIGNLLSDEEMEEINRKVYENYDSSFGTYRRQWDKDGYEVGRPMTKTEILRAKAKINSNPVERPTYTAVQKESTTDSQKPSPEHKKKSIGTKIKGLFGL